MDKPADTKVLYKIRKQINDQDDQIVEALASRQHFFKQKSDSEDTRQYAGPLQGNIFTAMVSQGLPEKFLVNLDFILSETPLKDHVIKDQPAVTGVTAADLDYQLLALFLDRYKIIQEVTLIKQQRNISAVVPERAKEVVQRNILNGFSKGLSKEFVKNIYELVLETAHEYEESILGKEFKTEKGPETA